MGEDQAGDKTLSSKRTLKWIAGIIAFMILACCGIPTVVYVFVIPTKIELVTGQSLPDSAQVVHSHYDLAPYDQIHRFVIAFTDDQARDQLVAKWNLQTGTNNIMGSDMSSAPSWWPTARIKAIEQNGECYGRVDSQAEQWWTLWVDRENNLLYIEAGDW